MKKKIGEYLIKKKACSEDLLDQALKLQSTLNNEGIYKPIGKIMVENKELDPEILEHCLNGACNRCSL